jgi:purine-binding chemotaxis protein CheW
MMVEPDELREDELTITASCHVLLLKAGNLLFCMDLVNVECAISLVAMQTVPGCAPYVAGIMNYAGSSLPVIDLAIRLGLQSSAYSLDTPIMICSHEHQRMGVIVQDIAGIQTLHEQDKQLTRELTGIDAAIRASVHTGSGLALLLDAAWLLQSEIYTDLQSVSK